MAKLIPISFREPSGQPRNIKGKFCKRPSNTVFQRAQALLERTKLYRPTVFFDKLLVASRFSKVHVDDIGRKFLNSIKRSHQVSGEGLPETLDDLSQAFGVRIGMLELRYPMGKNEMDYELVVVGQRDNLRRLETIRKNLKALGYE